MYNFNPKIIKFENENSKTRVLCKLDKSTRFQDNDHDSILKVIQTI